MFEAEQPWIVVAVVAFMIAMSAWIALRPLSDRGVMPYATVLVGLGVTGVAVLVLVTQVILDLPKWYEPRFVVPLAGHGVREQHEHDQPGGGAVSDGA